MKNDLHNGMCFVDYVEVVTKFPVLNHKNISKIRKKQGKKPLNLFLITVIIILLDLTIQIR